MKFQQPHVALATITDASVLEDVNGKTKSGDFPLIMAKRDSCP